MFTRAYVAFQVYTPLSMDIWGGIQSALDGLVYNVAFSIAGIHWGLLRAFLMMGHVISRINLWLSDQAFSPLIAVNSSGMRVAFTMAFVVALFILGITYMISVFIRLDVVNFQSALVWYIAGVLFFSIGPSLYQGMNSFRNTISTLFYLSVLDGIQTNDGGTFALGSVQSADLGLAPLCDYLGPYLQHPTLDNINGLDVALAYLHADGIDIMGYYTTYGIGCPVHLRNPNNGQDVASVPTAWFYNQSYFAFDYSPHGAYWDDEDQRSQAIGRAWQAHGRMLTAWPLVLFGVVEQAVHLLLTIAMGITFLIFSLAVLFGFFRRTEAIAQAVVNQWIELIVQTVIIGMLQAVVVGFFLMGTASGNALVVLAVGLVCLLLMLIVLWSGVRALWNSLNRLFDAFGQGAGQVFARPGLATSIGVSASTRAITSTASGASSALTGMGALNQGATRMQAAGLAFGGSQALSGSMRAIACTPSLRDTPIGDVAEQFLEGASARTIAKSVPKPVQIMTGMNLRGGVALLADRNPDAEQPMLLPAVGARLTHWTTPSHSQPTRTGTFTPENREMRAQREQLTASYESVGEEMEQHISDVVTHQPQSVDTQALERASQSLLQASANLQRGTLEVNGSRDVSSAVADALRLIQHDQTDAGGLHRQPIDHLKAGQYMAEAVGVTPAPDRPPLNGSDLARLGLFINQAQALGLSPRQVGGLIHDVKASPTGQLRDGVRETLAQVVVAGGTHSYPQARREVERLEQSAHNLPSNLSVYGMVAVPKVEVNPQVTVNLDNPSDPYEQATQRESALGGSGSVLGTGA